MRQRREGRQRPPLARTPWHGAGHTLPAWFATCAPARVAPPGCMRTCCRCVLLCSWALDVREGTPCACTHVSFGMPCAQPDSLGLALLSACATESLFLQFELDGRGTLEVFPDEAVITAFEFKASHAGAAPQLPQPSPGRS